MFCTRSTIASGFNTPYVFSWQPHIKCDMCNSGTVLTDGVRLFKIVIPYQIFKIYILGEFLSIIMLLFCTTEEGPINGGKMSCWTENYVSCPLYAQEFPLCQDCSTLHCLSRLLYSHHWHGLQLLCVCSELCFTFESDLYSACIGRVSVCPSLSCKASVICLHAVKCSPRKPCCSWSMVCTLTTLVKCKSLQPCRTSISDLPCRIWKPVSVSPR